jgi:MraZ protein
MFRGRFEHSIDEKGRLAIPAKFRAELSPADEGHFIVTNFGQCLVAYPFSGWLELEKTLSNPPQFNPQMVAFQRYFVSGATECPVDKAGRILLPAGLREYAKIERECVIAGGLKKFEIWSKPVWDSEFLMLDQKFGMTTEALANLGINI